MEIGQKVLFKTPTIDLHIITIGSGEAVGIIKDFDGEFVIVETGTGENYINKKDILKVIK